MPRTQLNRAIGKGVGVGALPTAQIKYFGMFGIGGLLLFMLSVDPLLIAVLFGASCASWLAATNDDPGALWDDLKKPKHWIQGRFEQQYREDGFPQAFTIKPKEIRYREGDQKIVANTAESEHKLSTYFEYRIGGDEVGAYLLQDKSNVTVIFCFEAKGISPSVSNDSAQYVLENVSEGVRQLPGVSLRFYSQKTSDADELIDAVRHSADETDLEFLIKESQKQRYEELASQGDLQSSTLYVYARIKTTFGLSGRPKGFIEKALSFGFNFFQGWTPTSQALQKTLDNVYYHGFAPIREALNESSQFGIDVTPLSAQQMRNKDWAIFHNSKAPPLCQCPVVTEEGIDSSFVNSDLHPLSELWEPENGVETIPTAYPGFVYLPAKDEYHGLIRIGRLESYPVKEGKYRSIVNYLHSITSDLSNSLIITEIEPQDTQLIDKFQMERTFNYSVGQVAKIQAKGSIDAHSERMAKEAAKAIAEIEDGHKSTYICSVIWVRDKDPEKIKTVLDRILPQLPLKSERVTRCAEYWFHQSLPFSSVQLGRKPTDRREKLFSSQMVGLLPLSRTPQMDPIGFPLVATDGTPLKLNMTTGKNNLLVVAASRAGKSILGLELVLEYYTQGFPSAVFDFPRPDGTSTYEPLVDFLNSMGGSAAYFDVGSETINCIEWIDEDQLMKVAIAQSKTSEASLKWLKDDSAPSYQPSEGKSKASKLFNRRLSDLYDGHIALLKLLVAGDMPQDQKRMMLESLLQNAYQSFCDEPQVKALRQEAARAPFGSNARMKMPTLPSFRDYACDFLDEYIKNQKRASQITIEAADFLIARLDSILSTKMGRAIGGHSSIDTSARLLVVALANVSDDLDTEIYALAADTLLTRKAIGAQYSAFIVDEGTIMFKRDRFSIRAEQKAANGHKWGMHLLIMAQTIDTILGSAGHDGIMKNVNNRLHGYIEEDAIDGLLKIGFKEHLTKKYINTSYKPDGPKIRSHWYFKRGTEHIECYHYPGRMSLAVGANDPDEEAARKLYIEHYPDKIEGLIEYAQAHETAKKTGCPIAPPAHMPIAS